MNDKSDVTAVVPPPSTTMTTDAQPRQTQVLLTHGDVVQDCGPHFIRTAIFGNATAAEYSMCRHSDRPQLPPPPRQPRTR